MMNLLIILTILVISIFTYFKIADRFNIIDKPNHRSSHTQITIRGGGIIFYIGLLLYYLFFGFEYTWFFIGATLIAAVSFVDDLRPISSKVRLVIQFTAMAMMFYECGLFSLAWYWWIAALIFTTGIINAYNFMDGINGITGGYSLVVLAGLWYANNHIVMFIDNNFIYSIGLALVVFNYFNFRQRAKCFAGDVGSVTIAFIICFMMTRLVQATGNFAYISMLSIYGIDAVYTIIHRLMRREDITEAHRSHTYQIMANELKIAHIKVSIIYLSLQILITAGFFVFYDYAYIYSGVVILLLSIIYLVFRKRYFHLHKTTIV